MTHRRAKDLWALFFPQPPDRLDFENIERSGVKGVMLHFWMMQDYTPLLAQLGEQDLDVILRVEEPSTARAHVDPRSYYSERGPDNIRQVCDLFGRIANVVAITVGNEPEHEFDLTWASKPEEGGWGNEPFGVWQHWAGKAGEHAEAVGRVVDAMQGSSVKVVAPGWTHRRITPHDPAQPGRAAWARLCTDTYNRIPNGIHLYGHGAENLDRDKEDYNRLLWALGNERERIHTEPWILEINTDPEEGSEVEHMEWVIRMYEAIVSDAHTHGQGLGAFVPFVSNGVPGEAWPRRYRMRDPAAYELLGDWLLTH